MKNGIMMQYFHWYINADGTLWKKVKNEANKLASLGITSVWLPPATKGMDGKNSHGYDIYDLYDLGEFDQKGSVATRFGTKEEYIDCVKTLQAEGIEVYVDIVLNHMGGADETEIVKVKKVDPEDRNKFISDVYEIEAYTKFTFPGRKGKYSKFIWDFRCFTGVDYDNKNKENAIFSIQNEYGEGWEEMITNEKGNFDYLMCADIEYRNEFVREEVKKWGKWYLDTVNFDGVRLDAVKHIPPQLLNEWVDYIRTLKPDLFAVGEYWAPGDLPLMLKYIEATNGRMSLFDAALHHNFYNASNSGRNFDLTQIFNDSLVGSRPELAVTVIDNHDTQPLQALEAPLQAWFKPLAYALILLREKGYPCIFYPDLYGAKYTDKGHDGQDHEIILNKCTELEQLLLARKQFAFGNQRDYLDHANCIGWTREGDQEHKNSGCAVILSNGDDGFKDMEVGKAFAGKTFYDFMQVIKEEITLDENGWGKFLVKGGKVSVWCPKSV